MSKQLVIICLTLLTVACTGASPSVSEPTPISVSGAWSNPTTWGGTLPTSGSSITIPSGKRVILDQDFNVDTLTINGTLEFASRDLNLSAKAIMVESGGVLKIGADLNPYKNRATITLMGSDQTLSLMGMGTKCICVMNGGRLEIHGEQRVSWTKLGATAPKDATMLTLSIDIDWRVGERIVVASSAIDYKQAEERTITAVNGRTVTLDRALTYTHYGEVQTFDAGKVTLDERAEVGLLTRNIVVQGDTESTQTQFGGHVMIMGADAGITETNAARRSSARVSGVEFRRLGQFDRLGRYPFHWHLNGPSAGDYIENSSVHSSIQRGIVVHNTSDVMVRNNVVWNVPGHAYMIEAGGEVNNTLEGNLALNPQPVTFTHPKLVPQNDTKASAYWINGKNNIFRNNVAGGGAFGGFWFDKPTGDKTYALTFEGNVVHSHASSNGAGVWLQSGYDGEFTNYTLMKFSKLTAYKNKIGFWADEVTATLDSSVVADNRVGLTGNANLTSTAVIGRTANLDDPKFGFQFNQTWGGVGVDLYNNASIMNDVTYINFGDKTSAVAAVACRNEGIRIRAERVRFVNARLEHCSGDTLIEDVDGTYSGVGRRTTLVSDSLMYTNTDPCTKRTDGSVACNGAMDHLYLFVQRDRALVPTIKVIRDVDSVAQATTNFPGWAITLPDRHYTLDNGVADSPALNIYIDPARKIGAANDPASRIILTIPAPNAKFKVWRGVVTGCFTCGFEYGDAAFRKSSLTSAGSLEAMKTADGDQYHYDATAKRLTVIVKRNKPVFIERTP
jgi:hypothetical protein